MKALNKIKINFKKPHPNKTNKKKSPSNHKKNPEAPVVLNVVEVFLLRTTVMSSKQNTVKFIPK